jgi:hypothetical protein
MEFKDMQAIWDEQNEETLYAINEAALHEQIKQKSKSAERKLDFFEWVMIGVNFIVAIILTIDAVIDGEALYYFMLPATYLGFSVVGLVRRLLRQKEEVQFDQTMLGELDKAIWQLSYLIEQGRKIIVWYLLPLMIVASLVMVLNSKPWWALGMIVVLLPLSYFGGRWEVNKFYRPKKEALEALRKTLIDSDDK